MILLSDYVAGQSQKDKTGYVYFLPNTINTTWRWDSAEINVLTERAAVKLGELNSFSKLVPNIDLFIQLHVTKEAVVSSRIEGTQTNIDEALLDIEDIIDERRDDWQEVKNYTHALNFAIKALTDLPISSRLLKDIHRILLDSVRGEHKLPGEFRRSQNWIGGSSLRDAKFIPPHQDYVIELMSDLEQFIHNDDIDVPALIKIAIAHYQFETIHPFLDGNGRIGRLLITLFLVDKGILNQPLLYLSAFFEQDKNLYYDNLTGVRTKNDMTQWLKYFLVGIAETAEQAVDTLSQVLALKAELEQLINIKMGRKSHTATLLLTRLFEHPIVSVKQVSEALEMSYNAANALINDFLNAGIVVEMTGQTRNRLFVFEGYLSLF